MEERLLRNVHTAEQIQQGDALCKGTYHYFHYLCDGFDDRGWGCGYRTLQTLCSWVIHNISSSDGALMTKRVPAIHDIQEALVKMEDKPESFIKSREWIGSFEACLCLDYYFDVPCKMIHVSKGSELVNHLSELQEHFNMVGAPVMMGGETDHASKCILGVRLEPPSLLILDPHYSGSHVSADALRDEGFIKWLPLDQLHTDTFYNLCLPKPNR